jgi:NAD(P)H-flavin reductase
MRHKIKEIVHYGYENRNLYLKVERGGIEFTPGMCCEIFNRTYSFASSVNDKENLEFLIKIMPGGEASGNFCKLRKNDYIDIGECFGFFNPGNSNNYSYIATGTGIAPFRSALLSYSHSPQYFMFGGRSDEDCFDIPSILKNLHQDTFFYKASSQVKQEGIPAHITDYINHLNPPDINPARHDYIFYMCGLDRMINDVSNILLEKGYTYDQIQTEQFYSKS